jgi:hypothetical protein
MASLPPYSTYRTDSKVSRSFAGRTQNVLLAKVPALGNALIGGDSYSRWKGRGSIEKPCIHPFVSGQDACELGASGGSYGGCLADKIRFMCFKIYRLRVAA